MTQSPVTVRDITIHFDRSGSGRNMMWGHGLTGSRALDDTSDMYDWSALDAALVRYDARGHGETTSTTNADDYSWHSLGLDQLALADELSIDRYIAGGASMGCATALHAAVLAPQRIEALVLMIPPTGWETRAEQVGIYEAGAAAVEKHGVEAMVQARLALTPADPFVGDVDYPDRVAAGLRSWESGRLAQALRGATRADLPERSDLAKIACPTLVLAWTGDPGHPVSSAEEITALIPRSTLHLASTADELATWPRLIAEFVNSLER